eukprot:GHRQ01000312.1.p2 GENE.GHRQ01000312.1~~GHRQ01000312.1.p2  ORF type:complete len:129 (+),score=1.09 GHRQ01000312.1:176-562(+)
MCACAQGRGGGGANLLHAVCCCCRMCRWVNMRRKTYFFFLRCWGCALVRWTLLLTGTALTLSFAWWHDAASSVAPSAYWDVPHLCSQQDVVWVGGYWGWPGGKHLLLVFFVVVQASGAGRSMVDDDPW